MKQLYQKQNASAEELNALLNMDAEIASKLEGYANSVEQLSLENPEQYRSPITMPFMSPYSDSEMSGRFVELIDSISEFTDKIVDEEEPSFDYDDRNLENIRQNLDDYFDKLDGFDNLGHYINDLNDLDYTSEKTPADSGYTDENSLVGSEDSKIYPEASPKREFEREQLDLWSCAEANLDRELRKGAIDSDLDRVEMLARHVKSENSLY